MNLDLDAIRSAVVAPEQETTLSNEELAVLAQMVLLSEPNGYFVDDKGYLKWSYRGLLRHIFTDLQKACLSQAIDVVDQVFDASYYHRLHVGTPEAGIRLIAPKSVASLLRSDIYRPRHDALLLRLRQAPLQISYIGNKGLTPESVTEFLRFCLHLSPEERKIVKWMAAADDSPVMQLMTRFGYMAKERRSTIANLLSDPYQLSEFRPRGDRTYREFVQLYHALGISQEENELLIYIGKSDCLADLGRRLVRMQRERREVVARML